MRATSTGLHGLKADHGKDESTYREHCYRKALQYAKRERDLLRELRTVRSRKDQYKELCRG
jgi:hypothetical protein